MILVFDLVGRPLGGTISLTTSQLRGTPPGSFVAIAEECRSAEATFRFLCRSSPAAQALAGQSHRRHPFLSVHSCTPIFTRLHVPLRRTALRISYFRHDNITTMAS